MEQAMQQQQPPTDPRQQHLAPPQVAPPDVPVQSMAQKISDAAKNDDLFSDDSDDDGEGGNNAVERRPEPQGEMNGGAGGEEAATSATATAAAPQTTAAAPAEAVAAPPAVGSTGAPTSLPKDVVHIQEVEWATAEDLEPGRYTEKAARPPFDRDPEPCGCYPDGTGDPSCLDMSCVLFACQEECRSNCLAGDLCGNKRIQRRQWKEIQVFDAGPKGRGLRVLEPIAAGDFISEYVGVAIKKKHLDSLFRRYQSERMLYIMALDNDVYIDARKRGGIARYINHSCEPNCMVDRWKVRGVSRACVFALRDLSPGEELTFDYKWTRKRGRAPTKCHCGSPSCRGTLEMSKESSLEDEELEMKLSGHWKAPVNSTPKGEIINRVIKVYFDGDHEYYAADVCQYDESTGKHQIIYKSDLSDAWEDLSKLQWMILDEEMQQFVIAKKSVSDIRPSSAAAPEGQQQTMAKNYVLVQNSVKKGLENRCVTRKCGAFFGVQINMLSCDKSELDAAEQAQFASEGADDDTTYWKLVLTGINMVKARGYVEHNVQDILRKATAQAVKDAEQESKSDSGQQEIVIPRSVTDSVKRNLHNIRTACRNVDVTFTHSDSKSKQFAKLILGANVSSDLERAQDVVWKELFKLCAAAKAPLTPAGVFKDLGILGGEVSSKEFKLLYKDVSGSSLSQDCSENLRESAFFCSFEDMHRCTIWVQSEEDMGRIDSSNRVVNEADPSVPRKIYFGAEPSRVQELWTLIRSRVDDLVRGVKFYNLGADRVYQPVLLQKLQRKGQTKDDFFFDYVHRTTGATVRVDNLTRNHLRIDGGDKTKEKGGDEENSRSEVDRRIAFAEELIRLQIELLRDHYIRKQRWGFGRDWTLLMDTDPEVTKQPTPQNPVRSLSPTPSAVSAARNMSDPRAVAGACMDIADITSSLDLDRSVAAHACIILYRFLNQLSGTMSSASQLKLREVSLACVFLANKAQKVNKMKRLEVVLEAAYRTFYAGAKFDEKNEEATNWEKRVIAAEREVLTTLEYDVFWPGVDWIVTAVVESGKVAEPMAENAMELALSGPVLAAGPNLWLKFGPEYAFAAMAGLLSINVDSLFLSLPLMPIKVSQTAELIAKAVQQNSATKKYSSKKALKPSHAQLFHGGQMSLLNNVPHVQQACNARMSSGSPTKTSRDTTTSSAWERNHALIAHRSRRSRVFEDVPLALVKECILPVIDGICAESRCSVFFEEGSKEGTENIVLEGSWRAISIAEHLLKYAVSSSPAKEVPGNLDIIGPNPPPSADLERRTEASQGNTQSREIDAALVSLASTTTPMEQQLPPSIELTSTNMGLEKMQAKLKPGVMNMSDIDLSEGWEGTVEPSSLDPVSEEKTHKIGGKTCLPGIASEVSFKEADLRWWIPPRYGPSRTGSLCDILAIRKAVASDSTSHSQELAKLASSLEAHSTNGTSLFTVLQSHLNDEDVESSGKDRSVAISLQRWPPEKVEIKEKSKSKSGMQVGFSPTALQEMQLLQQLHFLIPAPQGHPNFVLPVAVAMDSEPAETKMGSIKPPVSASSSSDDIFSLLNMIEQKPIEEKKKKKGASGSHLVFQPTPLVLQKIISRTKKRSSRDSDHSESTRLVTPSILASWFHDLLSALSMCHANHVILRTLNPDQILIDYSGVAMLSCLSRSVVLHPDDRGRFLDPLSSARQQKRKRGGSGDGSDDVSSDPYMAPELLLGSIKCTKETDMFSLGCLMAQLLLNKALFSGRDRTTKARAIFKVVGTSSPGNYSNLAKFPSYEDMRPPIKKYKRGVEKALRYMLKDSGVDIDAYSGALQLLDQMLHLDPSKRITAADALKHDFMVQHVDSIKSDEYRQEFVNDWMILRDSVLLDMDVKKAGRGSKYAGIGLVKMKIEATQQDKEMKRKALLMEAAGGDDEDDDDLYNMDDVLGMPASKKAKTGTS